MIGAISFSRDVLSRFLNTIITKTEAMARILTKEGLKKLQDELEDRKTRVRQEISGAIKEAKEQGDLSENAEYSEAKHEQNENETRILEIEAMLKGAVIATPTKGLSTVQIGSGVVVNCSGKERRFVIVGTNEVDPVAGKISGESPIGKALIGKSKGETAEIDTPAGKMKCVVVSVE